MKHYYAFLYLAQGGTTYGFIPISKDAVYQIGYYNPHEKSITLQSKDVVEKIVPVEKLDRFGEVDKEKGRSLVERRTLQENLSFRLTGQDKDWFINSFVENPEVCFTLEADLEKKRAESPVGRESVAEPAPIIQLVGAE